MDTDFGTFTIAAAAAFATEGLVPSTITIAAAAGFAAVAAAIASAAVAAAAGTLLLVLLLVLPLFVPPASTACIPRGCRSQQRARPKHSCYCCCSPRISFVTVLR